MYAEQAMMAEALYTDSARGQLVSPSLMNSTIKQIHELVDIALQANGTICDTRSRLFGPWPTNGEKNSIREAPNGQASELAEGLNRLRSALLDMRENASALSSAL